MFQEAISFKSGAMTGLETDMLKTKSDRCQRYLEAIEGAGKLIGALTK